MIFKQYQAKGVHGITYLLIFDSNKILSTCRFEINNMHCILTMYIMQSSKKYRFGYHKLQSLLCYKKCFNQKNYTCLCKK